MTVKRTARAATTLAMLLSALTACSSGPSRTPLVVYSPHGKDLLQYYEQGFERAHPNVDVQWVDMGSQDVLDRLRSEKANPQADLWFGAPAETFSRAANEGLLDAYRPTWSAAVATEARDAQDRWYGTYLTPEVIAYNTEAVPAADAPKDWDDVLDPRWKGKVVIRDPVASGSMRAIFGALIARSIARTGSTAQGFDWLRKLDANTREYALNPTVLYQKLGRREGVISLWDMPDIADLQVKRYPIGYRIPTSGTPLLVDAIAVVRGAKHPDVAKEFYEFVTTPHALLEAASRFNRIPARTDIAADSLPAWIRSARTEIKPMPVDQKLLADSLDSWMKQWDSRVRNCCRK
jgi:iron(III) transport system substrate-binding protein